jgi:hypothetical protein
VPVGTIVALLMAVPVGILGCHAVVYRVARASCRKPSGRTGRRPTAHTSALGAIALWFVVTMTSAIVVVWHATGAPASMICSIAYVAATYVVLAILYIDVVNIAETSLHMHLLLEVMWSEEPSLTWLVERYGAERMIGERLERLTALGQVRAAGGRFYLANRSTLRLNRLIDFWRAVLGLPTSSAQVDNS